MEPDLTVSRDIAASPEAVYNAITDITRMGEWSPENEGGTWNEGWSGAEVGATFTSTNRNGDKQWQIESVVTEAVPGERFFFDCQVRDFVFAKWGYTMEATDAGCTVTEYWQDLRPQEMRTQVSPTSGVGDRIPHNRAGMEATLEGLAAALEG